MKPLAIDLYAGLGGWTEGLLAEGYDVIGFDIERHRYPARAIPEGDGTKVREAGVDFNNPAGGDSKNRSFNYANECTVRDAPLTGGWLEYPAQLVIQDVMTLHGSQFRNADLIVASPPCQEYSYMAMPWSRAKAIAAEYRSGVRDVAKLTALFDACFRIQREACQAAGRHIPLVVENVRGAIPWVGRSRWNFGSFHLWGDVPVLMPMTKLGERKTPEGSWDPSRANHTKANKWDRAIKNNGGSWFNVAHNTTSGKGRNPDGRKNGGDWFNSEEPSLQRRHGSKSNARKMASAMIAKIPLTLSRHVAAYWHPRRAAA